jgi:hypothetical protein
MDEFLGATDPAPRRPATGRGLGNRRGQIETRPSMDDEVIDRPWGLQKAGFGHMGGCAAEVDVLSLEGVVIERGRAR